MDAVIRARPEPLARLRPDLPADLVAIVERAMRADPDARYQRIAELASDLRAFQRRTQSGLLAPAAPYGGRSAARRRVVVALALAAALAAAWWTWIRPAPAGRLAGVMYFDNLQDPTDADQLGNMLAWRLTTNLAAVEGVPMASQQRLHDVARTQGREDGRIDRGSATAVARAAGVTTMILGRVARTGERVVATAELVDVASGESIGAPRVQGAGAESVLELADELAHQVRALLRTPEMSPSERRALSQQLTTDVEAWRAYVRGETLLKRRRIDEASAAFDEAVAIDPSFALAHYANQMALVWTGDDERSMRSLERAIAFREKLPPAKRALIDATRPYWGNDRMSEALPTLLELIERDPYFHDVLFMLGEIYTHSALHNHSRRAAEVYERMLEADPDFSLVYEHLFNAYLRMGMWDVALERLADWRERAPDVVAGFDGDLALWRGHLGEAGERSSDPLWPDLLAGRLDAPSVTAITSRPLAELVERVDPLKGAYRSMALIDRAAVLAGVGRLDDAVDLCRRAYDVPPYTNSPDGFGTTLRMLSQHKLAHLLALRGDAEGARAMAEAPLAIQPESPRCLYTAVVFTARVGDLEAARRHARVLHELCRREITPSAALYRDAAAAELALAQGDAGGAREGYKAVVSSGRLMDDWYAYRDSAGPMFRDGLVRACLAAGDTAGAALALDALIGCGYERARHPVLWVQALATRGLMRLDSGRDGAGRDLLQQFLEHWGAADWDLPVVAEVRARLAG
jgi:tetratricopeptide (TPR) repeat protein